MRDVAKFIGFAQFYSRFIHHFEIRIAPLRKLTKLEYTAPVAPHWTPAAQAAFDDMKEAILSDPCLLRFDFQKLIVLRTDFSKVASGLCCVSRRAMMPHSKQFRNIGTEKVFCS